MRLRSWQFGVRGRLTCLAGGDSLSCMVLFCHPPPPLRISFHCENKGNCLSQCAGGTAADVRDIEKGGKEGAFLGFLLFSLRATTAT